MKIKTLPNPLQPTAATPSAFGGLEQLTASLCCRSLVPRRLWLREVVRHESTLILRFGLGVGDRLFTIHGQCHKRSAVGLSSSSHSDEEDADRYRGHRCPHSTRQSLSLCWLSAVRWLHT